MAILKIPIASSAAHFSQENEVFGHSITLEFEWIERESYWVFHIFEDNLTALALGIKVQPDWPLYVYHAHKKPIVFMLTAMSLGTNLDRHSLRPHFALVAYEAL